MAKTSAFTFTIAVSGDGATFALPPSFPSNAASPFVHSVVALSAGANTLTPPTGTLYALLIPSVSSTVVKTLKGVTGDTGVVIAPASPTFLSLASSPSAFVINASGAESIEVYWL